MDTSRGIATLLLAVVGATCVGVLRAQDVQWAARAGINYSDNANRTSTNELSTGAAVGGLQLSLQRPTGRLSYDLSGDLNYYAYLKDGVDNELVGTARAQATYALLSDRLVWDFRGAFDQQRDNIFLPASPSNRENILSLSTGPRLQFRFGDSFESQLQATFATTDYSERSLDNETISARLQLGRRLSGNALVGLAASVSQVGYDASPALVSDFDRTELLSTAQLSASRTDFSAELGYARIEGGGRRSEDPVARIRVTRALTPFVSAYLGLSQEYPTSESLLETFSIGGELGARSVFSSAPRLYRGGTIGLTMSRPRTNVDLGFSTGRESGQLTTLGSRETSNLQLNVARSLTPRSSLGFGAGVLDDEYSIALSGSREKFISANYSLSVGAGFGVDFQIAWRDRDSDTAVGQYSELSAGAFIRYGSVARRGLVRRPTRPN